MTTRPRTRRIAIAAAVVALLGTFGLWLTATVDQSPLKRSFGGRKPPRVLAGRDIRPEDLTYEGPAERLPEVWIAVRAALRGVLEKVSVADVAAGRLPRGIVRLTEDPEAWKPH